MTEPIYESVVRSWCDATGLPHWSTDTPQHVELDGHTVGLLYDPKYPGHLDVLFELAPVARPDVLRRLLQENLRTDLPHGGCYALHPESDAVVFRLRLQLTRETDGAVLSLVLHDALLEARQVLGH